MVVYRWQCWLPKRPVSATLLNCTFSYLILHTRYMFFPNLKRKLFLAREKVGRISFVANTKCFIIDKSIEERFLHRYEERGKKR